MEYEEFRGGEVNEGYIGINLNKREDVLYVQDAGLININTAISLQTEAAKVIIHPSVIFVCLHDDLKFNNIIFLFEYLKLLCSTYF